MAINNLAISYIEQELNLNQNSIRSVLTMLIDEEATVPFISRYRKERTGGLDEVQIREIAKQYDDFLEREKRREFILETLKKDEKLTPELEKKILSAATINQLEDIYAPFKTKKKTKGQIAIEAGLLPLFDLLMTGKYSLVELEEKFSKDFICKEKGLENFSTCLDGIKNILVEKVAHDIECKDVLRKRYWSEGKISSIKKEEAEKESEWQKFKDYFEFESPLSELKKEKALHRFLAIRRGMMLKILSVNVVYSLDEAVAFLQKKYLPETVHTDSLKFISDAISRAYKNHIHDSLDLEIKTELKKLADEEAIKIFGTNLKNLLLMPYLGAKTVMGIDPGVRTGCKLAIVDMTGKFIVDTVIYPHPPQNAVKESAEMVSKLIDHFKIEYIAIGNGTFGRETLEFLEDNVNKVKDGKINATLVSEAGASVYSASDLARKEFPDKDLTVRGAISIARRFQDPLAELVKIDPKSIGVGQYQHDVNQTALKKSLESVVESCVNFVGVDLNTASAPLLSFISGIGPTLADNIVKHREESGKFISREALLKIPRFSKKTFEQSAGFLRIYDGENPLDSTFIHPENYELISKWSKEKKVALNDLIRNESLVNQLKTDLKKTDIGNFTLDDIVKALMVPSQDPRTTFKSTDFRRDVKKIDDLKINEWYTGVVNNITQFGAFVDIGIKESGLLHISQIADKFVENPLEHLKVGEEIKVRVIEVDKERKRISLSCKSEQKNQQSFNGNRPSDSKAAKKHMPKEENLKNNAFAKLKNFKI